MRLMCSFLLVLALAVPAAQAQTPAPAEPFKVGTF